MLLPKLTGLDVLRALKADQATRKIPVVVLTSLSKGNADRLINEGAAAFFEKSDQTLRDSSAKLIQLIGTVLAKMDVATTQKAGAFYGKTPTPISPS